jgi:hypothetical protein
MSQEVQEEQSLLVDPKVNALPPLPPLTTTLLNTPTAPLNRIWTTWAADPSDGYATRVSTAPLSNSQFLAPWWFWSLTVGEAFPVDCPRAEPPRSRIPLTLSRFCAPVRDLEGIWTGSAQRPN